jgi:hypothetical protein
VNDAIAFMAWERVVPWKVLSMKARPKGPLVPLGFGTRNRDFPRLLQPGSQIWVVTRIARSFSLAGRVTVSEILDRRVLPPTDWPRDVRDLLATWPLVARADPAASGFFETNNAGAVLTRHRIAFTQNRTVVYRPGPLTRSFQACIDQARATVFLSYRWSEGRRLAVELARELRARGLSPWLDAMSMPDYEASREPGVNAPRLRALIKSGIDASRWAVVLNTRTYGKMPWTRMELRRIDASGIPWFQVMCGGSECECAEPSIADCRPPALADEILRRLGHRAFPRPSRRAVSIDG